MFSLSPHYHTRLFRPDIEGLRAIAILLVIGAHFEIPGISGGFVGVDIFFVISGYLITSILLREHSEKSKINLLGFYANRFRRLFPALATMLIATSFAAYLILPDTQNLPNSTAAAFAAVWASNLYFSFSDVDYFSSEIGNNLFLHTWSLGVEEQFYIIWPALILFTLRLAPSKRPERGLLIALLTALIASLVSCLIVAQKHSVPAFYLMPTRAWQFAAGAIVWLAVNRNSLPLPRSNYLSWVGIISLLASLIIIDYDKAYPGILAILPTLATCAFLWSGSNPLSLSGQLLSKGPLQWLGRISYSWYLWHWPVLIFANHLIPDSGSFSNTILLILLSLLLAATTHYLIENPIRFGRAKQVKAGWQVGATLSLMILLNSQFLGWNASTTNRMANQNIKYTEARFDVPFFYQDNCDDWYHSDQLKPCSYGPESAPKTAVLMGDSIGAQWFPALTHLFDPHEWKIIVLTKSSCPMVDEPFFYKRIGREYTECKTWRDKAINWLKQKEPNLIFLGSTASNPYTKEQLISGTRSILSDLSSIQAEIYLIEANPVLNFNGIDCLTENQQTGGEKCSTKVSHNSQYANVANTLQSVTSEYENVHWLKTAMLVCPDDVCRAERDSTIIYRDNQHLTASFTASAAPHFQRQLGQKAPSD
jgi:peptidoglycan/LPS O-acetylase OafA/YrhL